MHQCHFDTSEILRLHGVVKAIICPGSRNAPLTVSFARNAKIEKFSYLDERSAGYTALGMALATKQPVVACCTSGTALLNFGPAVAEAFYQNIPLIVISGDRPPSWIDQMDGQTIRQSRSLANHVKASYDLPVDLDHEDAQWEYRRKLEEALLTATTSPQGPVHINIPFREPFYPTEDDKLELSPVIEARKVLVPTKEIHKSDLDILKSEWRSKSKKLLIIGQIQNEETILKDIGKEASKKGIPVVADITGNAHELPELISNHDLLLSKTTHWSELSPDLVITVGRSLLSKNLKSFLRNQETEHWHFHNGSTPGTDVFKNLKREIVSDSLGALGLLLKEKEQEHHYQDIWKNHDITVQKSIGEKLGELPFSDFLATSDVIKSIPDGVNLHLANSMIVRYVNFFGLKGKRSLEVFCNRGTSGIDGSNSTAVGVSLTTDKQNVLLTGDLSLFYDRNAFLHGVPKNLKIIVFNNQEGGIFDLIKGPEHLTEKEKRLIKTPHQRDFQSFAKELKMKYFISSERTQLKDQLTTFWNTTEPSLFEIQTESEKNKLAFELIKSAI